jgi:hypothetical protein
VFYALLMECEELSAQARMTRRDPEIVFILRAGRKDDDDVKSEKKT